MLSQTVNFKCNNGAVTFSIKKCRFGCPIVDFPCGTQLFLTITVLTTKTCVVKLTVLTKHIKTIVSKHHWVDNNKFEAIVVLNHRVSKEM